MVAVDMNCLIGHWPFKKLYKNTFEDLKQVHEKNEISYGFVASLNSLFYNDPFEGEEELHEIIHDTAYKHILTVNPKLPGYVDDIKKGIELYDIKGVRIYPSYHGYAMDDMDLKKLCEVLEECRLPLFLSVRMGDERLGYILNAPSLVVSEINEFLNNNRQIKIVLLNIRYDEIIAVKNILNTSENVFFDTSGLKDSMFVIEKLLNNVDYTRVLYGSLHPMYCLKSTLLLVEKAEIGSELKQRILSENSELIFR